jgi:hypothetical protein
MAHGNPSLGRLSTGLRTDGFPSYRHAAPAERLSAVRSDW